MRSATTTLVFLLGAALALPAMADKGKGQNQGQSQTQGKGDNDNNDQRRGRAVGAPDQQMVPLQEVVIIDRDRDGMHAHYRNEFSAGRCPPGLAKKNNGCSPPGQVQRAWVVGQPLPPEVAYYPMPRELYTQLTPPPYGHEYVRVDDNIVLLNATTRLIAAILGNVGG